MERKKRTRIRPARLFYAFIFALIVIAGGYNLYRAIFVVKTRTLDQIIYYENKIPFKGFFIFDEDVTVLPGISEDLAVTPSRLPRGAQVGSVTIDDFESIEAKKSHYSRLKMSGPKILPTLYEEEVEADAVSSALSQKEFGVNDKIELREFALATEEESEYLIDSNLARFDRFVSERLESFADYQRGRTIDIRMNHAGVFVPYLDGYEDIYTIANMLDYDFRDVLVGVEGNSTGKFYYGYKIVNNLEYYLDLGISEEDALDESAVGKRMTVAIGDVKIRGTIHDVKKDAGGIRVTMRFMDGYDLIADKRFVSGDLIDFSAPAYRIPRSALIESDGGYGVKIVDNNETVSFRPVEILGESDGTVLVYAPKNGLLQNGDEFIPTVRLYDRVFLNPERVEEGELIN